MKPYSFISIAVMALILGYRAFSGPGYEFRADSKTTVLPYSLVLESRNLKSGPPDLKGDSFGDLSLEAGSAYIFDLVSRKPVFEFNSSTQFPLASLAKLMTVLLATENLPPDYIARISRDAVSQEGDDGLLLNEKWFARDLMDIALIASSNDAAFALAEAVKELEKPSEEEVETIAFFIASMNKRAREIGLADSYFLNPTGLDISKGAAGAYGSAADAAKLTEYIILNYPSLLDATRRISMSKYSVEGREILVKNTNTAIKMIPGIIAGKTGFTDLAGGNLMVIFDVGVHHPVIAVVMGSSFDGRFSDMMKLVEATFDYLNIYE